MSSPINITLFGDASPTKIALCVCGVVLVALIKGIKDSRNSRLLIFATLLAIFGILGFAYVSSGDGTASAKKTESPATANKPEAPASPAIGDMRRIPRNSCADSECSKREGASRERLAPD